MWERTRSLKVSCLFVYRLSKELQQKDDVIDSLRAKLTQHQPRSDTPCSSHALSDTTDQSDHISFVSDEQGSTNEDLELCSDIDAASEYGQEDRHASTTASTGKCDPPPGFGPMYVARSEIVFFILIKIETELENGISYTVVEER